MKRTLLTLLLILVATASRADEGMWLPGLISNRMDDLKAKGFKLSAEDIYSINQASMKDAVVSFGGFCTGELVSDKGLLITNHHCGYDAIQSLSSVEHDYLTYGFWAMNHGEELPVEDLYAQILVRMEEITARLAAGEKQEDIVAAATKEGVGYKASVEQMYYGNQQFLFVYERFDDVRLVGTPPSSIGKFGGETDNWIWPRHTGDFSIFRIYANQQNQPTKYSQHNRPYKPRHHLPVATTGVEQGDFTMIYGFPGNTQQYVTSDAVEYLQNIANPAKIAIRTGRLNIIGQAQKQSPALRIFYAAHHAQIANAWKRWQGETMGLKRLGTVATKRNYEEQFVAWAADKPEYKSVMSDLRKEYARIVPLYYAREILSETLRTLPIPYTEAERHDPLFEARSQTELALWQFACAEYARLCSSDQMISQFSAGVATHGTPEAYASHLFALAADNPHSAEINEIKQAIAAKLRSLSESLGTRSLRNLNSARLEELYKTYLRGLQAWDTTRPFFPDANSTLRVAYGSIQGYDYVDGEYHKPFTTLDGIIAKDDPSIYDYDIPQSLRESYAAKDYGRWGVEIDGVTTIPVCFLADNQTTGGNSGSPVINSRGELVGVNFDRTWRSTMSDVAFDPTICRNIAVDIRYVLFVIDKVGGASHLIDEMTLR